MSIIWKNKYANIKSPLPIVSVIIAAAGSGSRMGGIYKPMLPICDKKAILYSLEVFQKSPYVSKIAVSAKKESFDEIYDLAKSSGITKLACLCEGGDTRQQSVTNAFKTIFAKKEDITPFIAIHDAARPLITQNQIENAFLCAFKYGSAVCASRVRDTIKRTNDQAFITQSVDRNNLWQIQTPQIFDTDIFHTALSFALKNKFEATDESSLLENAGFNVKLFECSSQNIKITYPEDVMLAQAILENKKNTEF